MMNVKANERTLPVSIEASPAQILKNEAIGELFPSGSWVYLTDVGTAPLETMVSAANAMKASFVSKPVSWSTSAEVIPLPPRGAALRAK